MTTNPTIDGVPRELIERAIAATMTARGIGSPTERDLRALLDAPAVESELARMARRCQNAELALKVQTENYEALKAARPRGEPVVKLTWEQIAGLVNEVLGCEAHKWPVHDVGHAMTGINFNSLARIIDRVQSEQPAPVAVVLPERRKPMCTGAISDFTTFEEARGWNACLDEMKRLNTARPAHATPPPGAEPCGTHHDNDGLDEMRKP